MINKEQMEQLKATIGEFQAHQIAEKQQFLPTVQKQFHEICLPVLDRYGLGSFGWRQFEPWCDGSETSFEVIPDEDRDIFINGTERDDNGRNLTAIDDQTYVEIEKFIKQLPIDLLKYIFGDGAEIIVDKTGITVTEYYEG